MKSDGTVWSWGGNREGQLGVGPIGWGYLPAQVPGLTGVIAASAGSYHSLAVKSDGTVWTWGYNSDGQLGDGTTTNRSTPGQVPGLTGVTGAGGVYNHVLAVKTDGTVWAWGLNDRGQLGDRTTTNRLSPVPVTGLTGVARVAAGSSHSLAVVWPAVRTTTGVPIPRATVTLYRGDTSDGTFVQVPDGSEMMSAENRRNPDTTDAVGRFGWDVVSGFYKVRAEVAGCVSPVDPGQAFVDTGVLTVPPPFVGVDLRLACPDLAVTKTVTPVGPIAGQRITYTVIMTNTGALVANGVAMTDTLPAGVVFASATSSQGSCAQSSGIVNCPIGPMPPGAAVASSIVVTTTAAGPFTNTATVASAGFDADLTNNLGTAATLEPAPCRTILNTGDNGITGPVRWRLEDSPVCIMGEKSNINWPLTIDPGVIVKLDTGAYLDVYGSLTARGTKESKIYFTSLKDDTVGGDTNGDGAVSSPARADWRIVGGYGPVSELDWVEARYGGGPNRAATVVLAGTVAVTVTNSAFLYGGLGGGLELADSKPAAIANSVFANNDGPGLIALRSGLVTIDSSDFVANFEAGLELQSTSATVRNSLFVGNTAGVSGGGGIPPTQFLNNDVWGNGTNYIDVTDPAGFNGNVSKDPLFVDFLRGDYHLQAGSPAIDAGTLAGAPASDIDGEARPWGAGYDIGYDEWTPPMELTSVLPNNAPNGGTAEVTVYGSGFNTAASVQVKLARTGQPDIPSPAVVVNSSTISATFDLLGRTVGLWDLVVAQAYTKTLSSAFEIVPATPFLSVTITAPSSLSPSGGGYTPNPFTVTATVRNDSPTTANAVELQLSLPPGLSLETGSMTQAIGDLGANQSRQASWSVRAAGQGQTTTLSYFVTASGTNAPKKNASAQITLPGGALTIAAVKPNVGGDAGLVYVQIFGGGFQDGVLARLTRNGQTDLFGINTTVASDGLSLSTAFDLRGAYPGDWDVVVNNPDDTPTVLASNFTIQAGGVAAPWARVIGPTAVRTGRASTFFVTYGNQGTVDTYDVVLLIKFPADQPGRVSIPPPNVPGVDWASAPQSALLDSQTALLPIWLYSLPAGSSGVIPIVVQASPSRVRISVELWQQMPSTLTRTGYWWWISESAGFSIIRNNYDRVQRTAPGLLPTLSIPDFTSLLKPWLFANRNEIGVVPLCPLTAAAVGGVLNTAVSDSAIKALCDSTPRSVQEFFRMVGGN